MGSIQEVQLPVRQKEADASQTGPVKFGHELRDNQFLFDPAYRNLNHGNHPPPPSLTHPTY
jgi:hypothetical protein